MLYRKELEQLGYRVVEVCDPQEAVGVAKEDQPDLIVLEPDVQGEGQIVALQEIRGLSKSIPVVLHTSESLYEYDLRYGLADACVVKSPDPGPLKHMISEVLTRERGSQKC